MVEATLDKWRVARGWKKKSDTKCYILKWKQHGTHPQMKQYGGWLVYSKKQRNKYLNLAQFKSKQTAHKRHHLVASSRVGKHLEWRWWTPLGLLLLHASTEQISVQSSSSSWRHLVLCPGSVWWSSGHPQCFLKNHSHLIFASAQRPKGQRAKGTWYISATAPKN